MRLAFPPSRAARCAIATLPLVLAGVALAQTSALPATPSTNSTSTHRPTAEVHLTDGLLTVSATDVGLNQILREIARQTGMHVTGTVANLPVFGTYGPSSPSTIVSTLLDGSGSNFLYVDATATTPAQLTLTPRIGGPTPPTSQAAASNPRDEEQNNPFARPPEAQFLPPGYPRADNAPPQAAGQTNNRDQPTSTSQPVVFPSVGPTTPSSTATSTPANPDDPATNGVKTPQQIFEQLQKLRQQNQSTSQ